MYDRAWENDLPTEDMLTNWNEAKDYTHEDEYDHPNGGYDAGYQAGRESVFAELRGTDEWGTEDFEDGELRMHFADPGGNSALRAASARNPRILPCPNCGGENLLTPADRARGYVCDFCADVAEGKRPSAYY